MVCFSLQMGIKKTRIENLFELQRNQNIDF